MDTITWIISTPYPFPTCLHHVSAHIASHASWGEGFLNSAPAPLMLLLLTVSSFEKEQTFGNWSCLSQCPQSRDRVLPGKDALSGLPRALLL